MVEGLINAMAEYGVLGVMLAWTNFVLMWGAKKFLELFKMHTAMIGENSKVIQSNTDVLKDVKKRLYK